MPFVGHFGNMHYNFNFWFLIFVRGTFKCDIFYFNFEMFSVTKYYKKKQKQGEGKRASSEFDIPRNICFGKNTLLEKIPNTRDLIQSITYRHTDGWILK